MKVLKLVFKVWLNAEAILPSPLDFLRRLESLIFAHLWSEKGEIHVQSQLLLDSVVKAGSTLLMHMVIVHA